jgi:hypothetical protein
MDDLPLFADVEAVSQPGSCCGMGGSPMFCQRFFDHSMGEPPMPRGFSNHFLMRTGKGAQALGPVNNHSTWSHQDGQPSYRLASPWPVPWG